MADTRLPRRLPSRIVEFPNGMLVLDYLMHADAYGLEIVWGRVENPEPGDLRFRRSIGLALSAEAMEEGWSIFYRRPRHAIMRWWH